MKKVVSLVLALVMCLSLCGCEEPVSIEECVANANDMIETYKCEGSYQFIGEFYEGEDEKSGTYYIAMAVDTAKVVESVSDIVDQDSLYYAAALKIRLMDEKDTDTHALELLTLYGRVAPWFEKTDVVIKLMYINNDGTVTYYDYD